METNNPKTESANPQSDVPFRRRAWEFWRRNNIVLFQLPLLLAFLFTTYIVLKGIDSRIGVEGFGDLFGYLLNGVRASLIIFTAFWMKKWLWFDLHDRTELTLFEAMRAGDWMAFWIVVRDRAEWLAALAFATFWYTR